MNIATNEGRIAEKNALAREQNEELEAETSERMSLDADCIDKAHAEFHSAHPVMVPTEGKVVASGEKEVSLALGDDASDGIRRGKMIPQAHHCQAQ